MKLKTCEYCGTEYNSELPSCPLCGKTGAGGADFPKKCGLTASKKSSAMRGFSRMRAFPSADFQKSDNLPKAEDLQWRCRFA